MAIFEAFWGVKKLSANLSFLKCEILIFAFEEYPKIILTKLVFFQLLSHCAFVMQPVREVCFDGLGQWDRLLY